MNIGLGRVKQTLRDAEIKADKTGGKHSGGWKRKKGNK